MRGFRRLLLGTLAAASLVPAATGQDSGSGAARPPEGPIIIDLPSTNVPAAGTLGLIITHRFAEPLQDTNFHSLFSFDSGADVGIGLSYAPVSNLDIGVVRNRSLEDYEFSAKYRFLSGSSFSVAVRGGLDYRNGTRTVNRTTGFGQAILAVSLFSRIRLTAVPTYASRTAGQIIGIIAPAPTDVFNVPVAISIALTPTVNVHGEYVPRHENPAGAWIASIEKTVLRHRFAFTVGNLRPTTVDQYIASDFQGLPAKDIFIGFNLVRQWKLK